MKKSILVVALLLMLFSAIPAVAQTPDGEEYVVQRGDWLSKIAAKYYDGAQTYLVIVEATNAKAAEDSSYAVIRNPNLIQIGQKLWIPTLNGAAATDATATTEATESSEGSDMAATAMPNPEDYPILQAAYGMMLQLAGVTMQDECKEKLTPDAGFPMPEPDYTGKRALDLSAFESALADFSADRAAELDTMLLDKSIPELQAMMEAGNLTSEELVVYYVDRIQRYDIDKLNSVMELNPDALEIARTLDAERAAGTVRGSMHGIPVLFKDNIASGDQMHTTAGTAALQDWVADRDAFLVQQVRNAGGIVFGKANLSEWANYTDPCMPNGFSAVGGQIRNPYGPFDPLGSSGGSAVSASSNLTAVSVGSETAGSLIQPARANGIVALRPSQGLISRDYVVPLGEHLDTPGPMGRSVTDVAILLNAMTGVDPNDPKTSDAASLADTDFTQFLSVEQAQNLKVGVVQIATEEELNQVSQEDLQALLQTIPLSDLTDPIQAIKVLEAQGIEVVTINKADLPVDMDTAQPQLLYGFQADLNAFLTGLDKPAPITSAADVIAFNEADMANRAPYNHRYVKWSAETDLTAEDQAQLLAEAQEYANAWITSIMETYDIDVLLAGTAYANNAGAAGVPALTIPSGLNDNGKPQGIILTGNYLSDPDLLAVGYALEQAMQGRVEPDLDSVISTFPQ